MLSEEKIRLMIRLSNYESGQGKKDICRTEYYKGDYIRLQVLKTIVSVTLSALLLLGLTAFYKADYLLTNIVSLNYIRICVIVVLIYLLLIFIFVAITIHSASMQYEESKKRVKIYYDTLQDLIRYYDEEETDVNSIGVKK